MRVLVTGAEGFIARNLIVRLGELPQFEVVTFSRQMPGSELPALAADVDAVVHLAGVNRPLSSDEFAAGNSGLTGKLCDALAGAGRQVPVIFASSTQAALDNPYGRSKYDAEQVLRRHAERTGARVYIYRLPNVFGKWCRPNYNSVVATFCHNIARGLPIRLDAGSTALTLAHVDDVIEEFLGVLIGQPPVGADEICAVRLEYQTTLGELASQIESYREGRASLVSERVGAGFARALYSTFMSYLQPEAFVYDVPRYADARGVFVEMLKTRDSGQFSYFTAHPGITRGGHYHHTKTEKFMVIKGRARFGFRHILTNETCEFYTSGDQPQIVETIPGWSHDITNVGDDEMLVMLWANEIFDPSRPDTIADKV